MLNFLRDTPQRHVKKGTALLDRQLGPNWVQQINVRTLEISDPYSCVLGQLYGDFDRGTLSLGIQGGYRLAQSHGFLSGQDTSAWRESILRLQEKRAN